MYQSKHDYAAGLHLAQNRYAVLRQPKAAECKRLLGSGTTMQPFRTQDIHSQTPRMQAMKDIISSAGGRQTIHLAQGYSR